MKCGRGRSCALGAAAGLVLASAGAPAQALSFVDQSSGFFAVGSANLGGGKGFNFTPLDFSKSVSAGGIIGSSLTGHYGAKATATVGAKFGVNGHVNVSDQLTSLASGKVETFAFSASPSAGGPGSAFVLAQHTTINGAQTFFDTGSIDAGLHADLFAGANISAKVCVVGCFGGTVANLGIGDPKGIDILGYNSASNSVTFLGDTYGGALPHHFDAPGGLPLGADLEPLNLSGVTKTGAFHTQQTVASAYVDVAGLLASAFGIPSEALHGSVLGFDYTTVAAKIGVALNAVYDASVSLYNKSTQYFFSTPMQLYNSATGQWHDIGKIISVNSDQALMLRTASPISQVSITPIARLTMQASSTLTLSADLYDQIRLLELSGHGLDIGPLFSAGGMLAHLGDVGTFSASTFYSATSPMAPINLNFGAVSTFGAQSLGDDGGIIPIGGGRSAFVFVPDGPIDGDTVAGHLRLALNFGAEACNDLTVGGCLFDRSFEAIAVQRRTRTGPDGQLTVDYGVDFASIDSLLAMPEGVYGAQYSEDSVRALLASLPPPGSGGYDLGPQVAFGTTPTRSIPEPGPWLLMLVGFGLIGATARRQGASRLA